MAGREDDLDLIIAHLGVDPALDDKAFDLAIDQLGFGAFSDEGIACIRRAYEKSGAATPKRGLLRTIFSGDRPKRPN